MNRRVITAAAVGLAAAAGMPAAAQAALPTGNLLVNPGAEFGPQPDLIGDSDVLTHWTKFTDEPALRPVEYIHGTELDQDFPHLSDRPAGAGCRTISGPSVPRDADDGVTPSGSTPISTYSGFQDIAVPAEAIGKTVKYGALLARLANSYDYSTISLTFLDSGGAPLNTYTPYTNQGDPVYQPTAGMPDSKYTNIDQSITVPAGTVTARFEADVTADLDPNRGPRSYTNATVDNAYLTFDASVPAAPLAGCQTPAPTTGDASAVGTSTATLNGVIDSHTENGRYMFRFGVGKLDQSTQQLDLAASEKPTAVSIPIDQLTPNTTYQYALVATNHYSDKDENNSIDSGEEQVGQTKAFTTGGPPPAPTPTPTVAPPPRRVLKFDTFKSAIKIKGPSCVKKGVKFTVTATDTTNQGRKLVRFFVAADDGINTPKDTKGKVGTVSSTIVVKKFPYKAPPHTKGQKMILSVEAKWGDSPLFPAQTETGQDISGQKQFKFCKQPAKKKSRKK